ncbi:MAG: glucosaminidase domain-containing protein [Bacteroidia bacterium]|nr:glucosaminidase domain-containing protein [Bacteroidia bacterium]
MNALGKTGSQIRVLFFFINYRRLILLLFLSFFLNSGFGQVKSFVDKFGPLTDSLSIEYSIPRAVILGVSIIESGSGTSRNCKLLNNYFGMVGKNNLYKTKRIKTRYKQYPDAISSFIDFCKLMTRKKFYKKLKENTDYKLWIDAISKASYSEVPETWKQRVLSVIRKNKLYATL